MIPDTLEQETDHPDQNTYNIGITERRILNAAYINDRCRNQNQQDTLKDENLEIAANVEAISPFLSPFAIAKIFRLLPIPKMHVERKTDTPDGDKNRDQQRPGGYSMEQH